MTFSVEIYDVSKEWLASAVGQVPVIDELKRRVDELLVAERLAERYLKTIERNSGKAVLGFFTGSTPLEGYRMLAKLSLEQGVSWKQVEVFALDEYVGLAPEDPRSFASILREHLFSKLDIPERNLHLLSEQNLESYEMTIKEAGGILLQGCGIGLNGHLAFNEPGSPPDSRTRRVRLSDSTRKANAKAFDGDVDAVPEEAYSMGIATILEAKRVDVYITGAHKADIAEKALLGKVTKEVPASAVQQHQEGKFILDGAAAARLTPEKLRKNKHCAALIECGDAPEYILEEAMR